MPDEKGEWKIWPKTKWRLGIEIVLASLPILVMVEHFINGTTFLSLKYFQTLL